MADFLVCSLIQIGHLFLPWKAWLQGISSEVWMVAPPAAGQTPETEIPVEHHPVPTSWPPTCISWFLWRNFLGLLFRWRLRHSAALLKAICKYLEAFTLLRFTTFLLWVIQHHKDLRFEKALKLSASNLSKFHRGRNGIFTNPSCELCTVPRKSNFLIGD